MEKLTIKEKRQILKDFKKAKWSGCACDKCLFKLIEITYNYLNNENKN